MRALSIRQPYAELILRGLKPIEFRSRPTRIIGERFYIYASKKPAAGGAHWAVTKADNIVVPTEELPRWMIELANAMKLFPHELPTGVIVGSAIIDQCSCVDGIYHWRLKDIKRIARPRKPRNHPQPSWFNPF
jgi:hypothetical protein